MNAFIFPPVSPPDLIHRGRRGRETGRRSRRGADAAPETETGRTGESPGAGRGWIGRRSPERETGNGRGSDQRGAIQPQAHRRPHRPHRGRGSFGGCKHPRKVRTRPQARKTAHSGPGLLAPDPGERSRSGGDIPIFSKNERRLFPATPCAATV